ncbi:NUDIX domain-containing protein [Psychromarinibacter halotolerans]|uniref:ADP-ribose pyrophosphatase n=1 Tax=Psychromarinibacter halotolerans TaxID=1775175 RepID=A0ABV7GWI9_9RHOB|nr:NUDIX domain-containing protein [Psychromarinibacter halotolerans]MDF0597535.1 NUDIX domain-containing protein [Psychromarinibacter halotolerans]
MTIFLYGPLRFTPLMHRVLGVEDTPTAQPAVAPGWRGAPCVGGVHPVVAPVQDDPEGEGLRGIAFDTLPGPSLARLSFCAEVFGLRWHELDIEVAGTARAARMLVPDEPDTRPGHWALDDWIAKAGDAALRLAGDVMGRFGHANPASVRMMLDMALSRADSHARARRDSTPPVLRKGGTDADVEIVERRRPYTHFFQVEETDLQFRRFDGSLSETVTRAAFVMSDAVTVLPYDPVRDRVLLVEQFRFGPLSRGDRYPWSLEPVAGRIDAGGDPEETARREAQEEAGLTLGALEQVARYYPSPGAVTEYLWSFVGIADLPDSAAVMGGLDEEAEDIRGVILSFDDLMAFVSGGEAENGPLILTAHWLAANRDRLRRDA